MNLLVEHWVVAAAVAAIAAMAVAGHLLYRRHREPAKHPSARPVMAAFVAGVILASLFTQLANMKRERDAQRLARRTQHLQQLQALLKAEGLRLKGLGGALLNFGHLQDGSGRAAIWFDEALSDDVGKHFPDYYRGREALIERLLQQDRTFVGIAADVTKAIPLLDNAERYRRIVTETLLEKCWRAPTEVELNVSSRGYFYGVSIAPAASEGRFPRPTSLPDNEPQMRRRHSCSRAVCPNGANDSGPKDPRSSRRWNRAGRAHLKLPPRPSCSATASLWANSRHAA
jgi:hypothetical protein